MTVLKITTFIILTSSWLLMAAPATGQNFKKKWFFEISNGPSFPLGPFKSTEDHIATPNSNFGGAAKTGWAGRIGAGKYITENAGFVFSIGGLLHGRKIPPLPEPLQPDVDQTFTGKSDPWKVGNLAAGAFYRFPLNKTETWKFDFKTLAGVAHTSVPEYSLQYFISSPNGQSSAGSATALKRDLPLFFSFQAEAGVSFKLNENFYISMYGRYFNARTKKQGTYRIPGSTQPGSGTTYIPDIWNPTENTYIIRTISPLITLRFLQQSW